MASEHERNTEPISATSITVAHSGRRQPCLIALKGPEQGAVYRLEAGTYTLGRAAGQADIVLLGRGLSRVHARLEVSQDGVARAVDLDSTNGLFINGQRVAEGPLEDGDSLALGPEVVLQYECPAEAVHSVLEETYRGATRDALTGLLNRKTFLQRLAEEHAVIARHGYPGCVAILDADHFKSVNDTHGHPAGDAVLVELARRLLEATRTEDVVARFGGEEFVVLIRSSGLEGAAQLLERVRVAVAARPFVIPTPEGQKTIRVTVSAGLCELDRETSPDRALDRADQALYQAKNSGRNRVCSHPPSGT